MGLALWSQMKMTDNNEKGSLALEQVLFIGAVVAMAAGLFLFYENISVYLSSVGFSAAPLNIGTTPN